MMNVLQNAADAVEHNEGEKRISIVIDDSESNCLIRISDNGCGIDKSLHKKIFDTFYTTKAPGEGTGMGLSIVHSVVEAMGGRIEVVSRPGEGSSFILIIPKG